MYLHKYVKDCPFFGGFFWLCLPTKSAFFHWWIFQFQNIVVNILHYSEQFTQMFHASLVVITGQYSKTF